jgi:hypothetical protein
MESFGYSSRHWPTWRLGNVGVQTSVGRDVSDPVVEVTRKCAYLDCDEKPPREGASNDRDGEPEVEPYMLDEQWRRQGNQQD